MATIVANGIIKQISATLRHGIKLPNKNTIKNPSVAEMPAHAVKMPRIDGSLKIKIQMENYRWFQFVCIEQRAMLAHSRLHDLPNFADISDDRRFH